MWFNTTSWTRFYCNHQRITLTIAVNDVNDVDNSNDTKNVTSFCLNLLLVVKVCHEYLACLIFKNKLHTLWTRGSSSSSIEKKVFQSLFNKNFLFVIKRCLFRFVSLSWHYCGGCGCCCSSNTSKAFCLGFVTKTQSFFWHFP